MHPDQSRLFSGVVLPDSVRRELTQLQAAGQHGDAKPEIAWQQCRNLHLTLNFIGVVARAQLPALTNALARIRGPAFSLRLEGVGYFGSAARPRVLWAGMTAPNALLELQQQGLNVLSNAGFKPDDRPYHPHVTLGRCRQDECVGDAVASWLNTHADFSLDAFPVDRFCLFESTRDTKGLRYDVVQTYALHTDRT